MEHLTQDTEVYRQTQTPCTTAKYTMKLSRGLAKKNRDFSILTLQETESRCRCTRKVRLSQYLRKKFPTSEGSGFIPSSSTNILSPSYCGWYFPAILYKIMSRGSHSAKLESMGAPGNNNIRPHTQGHSGKLVAGDGGEMVPALLYFGFVLMSATS